MKSFKHLYDLSFKSKIDYLHFAAHSHHPWPDCTFEGHKQYWMDSAAHLDNKWNHIFTNIVPKTQKYIAEILNLSNPETIVIAPNTHEFVVRLFSCFEKTPIKVLTTDGEFHSFRRQLQRMTEAGQVQAKVVPVEPYNTFEKRWAEEIEANKYDMIFTSQVFFNSGLTCPKFETWIPKISEGTMTVVDGYHAFCAIPTDLKKFEDKIFYIAGGYKYAQGGEGVCFMVTPKKSTLRPINTGWFASFETLSGPATDKVQYSDSGMRFAGSTFDPSGCYRFNAVMETFKKEKLDVSSIHSRVSEIKDYFVEKMSSLSIAELDTKNIIQDSNDLPEAHFVTFKTAKAKHIEETLAKNDIIVDSRGDRLRFGFGVYHDLKDVDILTKKLNQVFGKTNSKSFHQQVAKSEAEL